ncbi:MAG: YeeE/YedE thiosulfate transporter family protein [Myxococcota bacterium]
MSDFTPVSAAVGGLMIGLSAALLLFSHGRIAGVSGILGGLLRPEGRNWRASFVLGMGLTGAVLAQLFPSAFAFELERTWAAIAVAGLLVGVGTRLGSGCTSGHGVCGISRLSPRSTVATLTFIAAGAVTVYLVRTYFGGMV